MSNFHDARGEPCGEGILGPDPNVTYPLGKELACKLIREGSCGIIYPSVRNTEKNGICLVAFQPEVVQNARYGKFREIIWNKESESIIDRVKDDPLF